MTFDHWLAVVITGMLVLELRFGAALLPVPLRRTPSPKPINYFAFRDKHQFVYWVTMVVHSAVTACLWWLPLTGQMTS